MEIVKKYHFNGKVYDSHKEAEKEAIRLDNKYAIKNILLRNLWSLCYDIDSKYETVNECKQDKDYEYDVDIALNYIIEELQYEENKEKFKKFIYGESDKPINQ